MRNEFNSLLSEGTNRASSEVSGCGQWVWPMTELSYTWLFPIRAHSPMLQSQSHGKIVRKLSKKLKVSSRCIAGPTDYLPVRNVRPPSPVLYSANPAPLHLHSLLEQSDSNSSGNTSIKANSVPGEGVIACHAVCVSLIIILTCGNHA